MDKIERLKELKSLLDSGVIELNEFAQMKSEILGGTSEKTSPGANLEEVKIGLQTWVKKNLDVSTFRNGDAIPCAESDSEWEAAGNRGQPAWCYYDNDPVKGKTYGKLYNWFAVNDKRGLAPAGWHVPSDGEWKKLFDFLGGEETAGTKMKNTRGWNDNGNGNNASGFSALPGGYRHTDGSFHNIEDNGYWWSYTESGTSYSWFCILSYDSGNVDRVSNYKQDGFSVRCLGDF